MACLPQLTVERNTPARSASFNALPVTENNARHISKQRQATSIYRLVCLLRTTGSR